MNSRWTSGIQNLAYFWPNFSHITNYFASKEYQFQGSKYWKFENMKPYPGYPKDLSGGFPGIPNNIDAAFVWSGNGKIYFFKVINQ